MKMHLTVYSGCYLNILCHMSRRHPSFSIFTSEYVFVVSIQDSRFKIQDSLLLRILLYNIWDICNKDETIKEKKKNDNIHSDASSFQLQSLCEAITYLFRIQALSRLGPGKVATTHFTTPVLTVTTPKRE